MAVPVFQSANTAFAATSATSMTITAPSGVVANDIVLAHMYVEFATAITLPAGFTEVINSPVNTTGSFVLYHRTFWKRSTGSEPASYTFSWTGSSNADRTICVQRYSGCITSGNPVEVTGEAARSSTGTTTPPVSLTTGGADRLIVWSGTVFTTSTWTAPTNYTLRSSTAGGANTLAVATRAQAVPGSTGSVIGTSSGSMVGTAFILALLPAVAATTNAPASTATLGVAAQNASLAPGTILGVGPNSGQNHFNVQVSRRGDADILIKTQEEIRAGYNEDPWFTANSNNSAVQLYAPVDGPTTSGAASARCELREVFADGSDMGFDPLTGTHTFHGRSRVVHDPPVLPDIVVAQLHNGSVDRVAIRTQLVSGTRRLRIRINGSSATLDAGGLDVQNPYVVGTEIEWKIELTNGTVRVYIDDMVTAKVTSTALVSTGSPSWYFKAGCYIQSTTTSDLAGEYGEVELRDLQIAHSAPANTDAPAGTGSFDVSAQTPAAGVSSSVPSVDVSVAAPNAGGQVVANAGVATLGVVAGDASVTAVAFSNAPAGSAALGVAAQDASVTSAAFTNAAASAGTLGFAAQDASVTSSGAGNATTASLGVTGLDAGVSASGSATAGSASLGVSAQDASATAAGDALASSADASVAAGESSTLLAAAAGTAALGIAGQDAQVVTAGFTDAQASAATLGFAAGETAVQASSNGPAVTATFAVAALDGSVSTQSGLFAEAETAQVGFGASLAYGTAEANAESALVGVEGADATVLAGRLALAVTATIGVDANPSRVTLQTSASVAMLLTLAQLPEVQVPALIGFMSLLMRQTVGVSVIHPPIPSLSRDPGDSAAAISSKSHGIAVINSNEHGVATINSQSHGVPTIQGMGQSG